MDCLPHSSFDVFLVSYVGTLPSLSRIPLQAPSPHRPLQEGRWLPPKAVDIKRLREPLSLDRTPKVMAAGATAKEEVVPLRVPELNRMAVGIKLLRHYQGLNELPGEKVPLLAIAAAQMSQYFLLQ